jgi:hypothetical protein
MIIGSGPLGLAGAHPKEPGLQVRVAICRIGHLVSEDLSSFPAPDKCRLCGKQVYTTCWNCGVSLLGLEFTTVQASGGRLLRRFFGTARKSPKTCPSCGDSYPWAFAKAAAYHQDQTSS